VKDQALFSWRSSSLRGGRSRELGGEEEDEEAGVLTRQSKAGVIGPAAGGYHSCLRLLGSEASEGELGTMEISPASLSGYLFLKSCFYNMQCCPVLKSWRLRYFTLDRHGLHSRKTRESARRGPQTELIDLQSCRGVEVTDRARGLFVVHRAPPSPSPSSSSCSSSSSGGDERPYEFAATSLELLDEAVSRLESLIREAQTRSSEQQLQFNRKAR
jgi:hypothetical protein